MVRPARNLLWLLGAWFALAAPACLWPGIWRLGWRWAGCGLALLAVLDALLAWSARFPVVERQVAPVLPVGVWSQVRLRLSAPGSCRVRLFDGIPPGMEVRHLPRTAAVRGGGWTEVRYDVRPGQRGSCAFTAVQVLLLSPLGLWWRRGQRGSGTPVKVYPNFAQVKHYAELARAGRLTLLGIHKRRRRGEGSDFHQLRDFREGDSLRQLDWKATARMHRLISREYQEERDQQVVILLDCGRRMRARDGRLGHFDQVLTGVLLLAYVALREGDAVGLATFGGPDRHLAPRKTPAALDALMAAVHDLEPSLEPTDYLQAAGTALARLRKRSLVVMVTNLRDEDDDTLGPALRLLARRHRVILAGMREPELDAVLRAPVQDFAQALRIGAVHGYLEQRRRAFQGLAARGCAALDVLPAQLPVALVNRYLAEKRSGAA